MNQCCKKCISIDEILDCGSSCDCHHSPESSPGKVGCEPVCEDFIKDLLESQRHKTEKNIGMLRQWLNEDRITEPKKMVTNEEISKWLELSDIKKRI